MQLHAQITKQNKNWKWFQKIYELKTVHLTLSEWLAIHLTGWFVNNCFIGSAVSRSISIVCVGILQYWMGPFHSSTPTMLFFSFFLHSKDLRSHTTPIASSYLYLKFIAPILSASALNSKFQTKSIWHVGYISKERDSSDVHGYNSYVKQRVQQTLF